MIMITAGLRRTASLAMYQVMREIVSVSGIGYTPFVNTKEFDGKYKNWGNGSEMVLLKLHSYRKQLDNLSTSQVAAVMNVRDPRDVIISIMTKYGYPFDMAFESSEFIRNLRDHSLWLEKIPNDQILVIRYEDFIPHRKATIFQVANFMGQLLTEEQAEGIDETWNLERNRLRAKKESPVQNYNYVAKRHIGDGSIGQWKERLTYPQTILVEEMAEDWMIAYEYDSVEGM